MTFSEMVQTIMPEVERGGVEPFLIYRDADGGWHGDFTRNQYGETYDWVAEAIESDKAAFVTRGLDFAGGSMPYVFDKVLSQRLRNEYYNVWSYDQSAEHKKVYALLNFFEDNAAEFSRDVTDYLTAVERPLAALLEMCPFNMATGRVGWTFNEDLAPDALDKIEYEVKARLENSYEKNSDKPLIERLHDNYANRGVGDMGLFNLMLFIKENANDISSNAKDRLLRTIEPLDWLGAELYERGYELDKGIGGKGGVSEILTAIEQVLDDEPAKDGRIAALGGDVEAADRNDGRVGRDGSARIISTITLENRQINIGEDISNPKPFFVEVRTGGERVTNARTDDYFAALRAYAALIHDNVHAMEVERGENADKYGERDIKLTGDHILPGSKSADFTKQLIIVDPACLMPEYRFSTSQLVECTHGNGARPDAIGTSVFGTELYSGKSVAYGRHEILGIADESVLPKWAGVKLEAQRDGTVFEYGGCHFKPVRRFRDGETEKHLDGDSRPWKTDAQYAMRNMSSDHALGIAVYDWGKSDYSRVSFLSASKDSDADIFRCLENGKLYVPCENELSGYNEPPLKERAAQNPPQSRKKPSLLGRLDSNKAKVARDKAANPVPPNKNRQKEVGD